MTYYPYYPFQLLISQACLTRFSNHNMGMLFLFALLLSILYLYLKYVVYNVWIRAKVPHDTPSLLFGTIPMDYIMGNSTIGSIVTTSYKRYKRFPFHGVYIFYRPVLVITDPTIIQLVLVKNSNIFHDRGFYADEKRDMISLSLARINGERLKALRRKFTPCFSPKRIKLMFPVVKEQCDRLMEIYEDSLQESEIVEINDFIMRFTTDCSFATLFGFSWNLLRNPDNEIYKYGKQSNEQGVLYSIFSFFLPELAGLCLLPKIRKEANSFFIHFFENIAGRQKEKNNAENNLLSVLMQLRNRSDLELNESEKLTLLEASAQFVNFLSAGQVMPAFAIIHCLYELSFNPEIQETLYEEIYKTSCQTEELTYQKLHELPYLDAVFQETLRKHIPIPVLNRIASEDFPIPNSDMVIKKNMRIAIPVEGLHSDSGIYIDPDKFDPTRFTPENKAKRHPCTYLPFGIGPRFCIAKQQGILVPKVILYYLLLNYKFSVCDKTPTTLEYLPGYLIQTLKNEVYLKIERRNASHG